MGFRVKVAYAVRRFPEPRHGLHMRTEPGRAPCVLCKERPWLAQVSHGQWDQLKVWAGTRGLRETEVVTQAVGLVASNPQPRHGAG